MKRIYGLILFLTALVYTSARSFAQDTTTATIDSLVILLMNDNQDTSRVDVYNQLADEFLVIDYQKSLEYSELAVDLADKLLYDEGLLDALMSSAHIHLAYILNYHEARKNFDAALPIALRLEKPEAEMEIYQGLSYIYSASKKYRLALDYNKRARAVAEEQADLTAQSELNSYLGGILEQSGDTLGAIDAYAEVLALERQRNFKNTSNASMMAVGRYYQLIEDYGQALKYYKIVLKNAERNDDYRWLAYTHAQMAILYILRQDSRQAEEHALHGLEIAETYKLQKEIADNYLSLQKVYIAMDSADKAEQYRQAYDSISALMVPVVHDENATILQAPDTEGSNAIEPNPLKSWIVLGILIILPLAAVVLLVIRKRRM